MAGANEVMTASWYVDFKYLMNVEMVHNNDYMNFGYQTFYAPNLK